jgi:hypothetical protein
MGSPKGERRQLNGWVNADIYDRVSRAARKANMTRSGYAAAFLTANIDLIDPEGATPQETE